MSPVLLNLRHSPGAYLESSGTLKWYTEAFLLDVRVGSKCASVVTYFFL